MKIIVISLGGSIINPGKIDYKFLKEFKQLILKISKNNKIIICTGGGKIARDYIEVLKDKKPSTKDLMGIQCTRLNAYLLATFINDSNLKIESIIPTKLKEVKELTKKYKIIICGGLEPGKTSDGTTAEIAQVLKAKELINITNVDGLFNKDPKKYRNAKFIPLISHQDFKDKLNKIREGPGQHFVLDSHAADICRKENIKVIILQGVRNLKNYLEGKKFTGTIVF